MVTKISKFKHQISYNSKRDIVENGAPNNGVLRSGNLTVSLKFTIYWSLLSR